MRYFLELAAAFTGSMGFAMIFHVRREKLFLASLGGMLAWGVYLLMGLVSDQDVVRSCAASVFMTVYAEVLARVVKCPATLFIATGCIPLVPGSALYHTMEYFMDGDVSACLSQGLATVLVAVSIALGMLFPTSIFRLAGRTRGKCPR